MKIMNWAFKHLFSREQANKPQSSDKGHAEDTQVREKKEAAFNEVGERYGRAITHLSDT